MNEQEETTQEESKNTENDIGKGSEPQTGSILERVQKENERMESNIRRQEEIIARQENVAAKAILAGTSEAGPGPKVSEEQKKIDGAADFFKGSQLEKDIRKANE